MLETVGNQKDIFLNKQINTIKSYVIEHKVPIITSFVVAFLSYMFAFTNKLVNHDEIISLFSKGATLTSGRWGLTLTSVLFPDISMPWIYGIISIVLITLAICLILDMFEVKNSLLRALLSGLIISFPSLVGIFSYMFTSASFSLSFLLAVWSAYLIITEKKHNIILSVVALIFSVSIYQAYIAVTASLLVIYILHKAVSTNEDVLKLFKKSLLFVFVLAMSLGIYYGITKGILIITGNEFGEYVNRNLIEIKNVLFNILHAYLNFFAIFIGRFDLITNPVVQVIHIFTFVVSGCMFVYQILKKRDIILIIFSLLVLALFPLSVCCVYLFIDISSFHSLMMYSFVSVYVWMIICFQNSTCKSKGSEVFTTVFPILLAVSVANNVYVANSSYLQLHLAYENAYSYYSSVMTSVVNTEGFDSDCKLVLYADGETIVNKYDFKEEFGEDSVMGISYDMINVYSREYFINYYLGYDIEFATKEEIDEIIKKDEFKEMQVYPYYGSVQKIDNYIVVRLSE